MGVKPGEGISMLVNIISFLTHYLLNVLVKLFVIVANQIECPQASPPHSGNFVKASVSDKKKFFENAMEESHKPSPKPGKYDY